jgi:hypothetical protein
MRDYRYAAFSLYVTNDFLRVCTICGRSDSESQNMHATVARIFKPGDETKAIIRKQAAFSNVSCELVGVERFGVIRHTHEVTVGGNVESAQLGQGKLSIGVGAMNVDSASQHEIPFFVISSYSALLTPQ